MRLLLFCLGFFFFFGGCACFVTANTLQDRQGASTLMIVGAVFLSGAGVVEAVNNASKGTSHKKEQSPAREGDPQTQALLGNILNATNRTNEVLEKLLKKESKPAAITAPDARYFYSGEDLKICGPFDGTLMRAMAKNGTINHHTPVQRVGSDEWLPYEEHADLA